MSLASRFIKRINEARLHERFPSEFWKQLYDSGSNKNVIDTLNKINIDIENSNISPVKITSSRDPKWKANGIIILIGDDGAVVTQDGKLISKNDTLFAGSNPALSSEYVSWNSSYKAIINAGTNVWFIPESDYVSNADLRAQRKQSKAGDINLNRREHAQKYDPYSKDWKNDRVRYTNKYYDKSGYLVDTYKYKEKLKEIKANDNNWKKDAEAAIDEYESYIDLVRSNPRDISKGLASKINNSGLFGSRSTAMRYIADLGDAIEKIFKSAEKLEQIKAKKGPEWDGRSYYQYDLEDAIEGLTNIRNNARKFFNKVYSEGE